MQTMADDVGALRQFSRYFTRRLGVLNDRYLGQDRPLGSARLLFEIGSGASLRDLRTRLGLDAGYLSRLIRGLEREGLVRMVVPPHDGRLRVAQLTPEGRAELAEQDRRANDVAADLLGGLSAGQRAEVTGAIRSAARLLRLSAITIEVADPAGADARGCLAAFAAEIDGRFPEGFDPADLVAPGEVRGQAGAMLVAYEEGAPVGCGALRTLEPGVGEIRHVWVAGTARGLGLARRLVSDLERQAATRDLNVIRLGTHRALTEATQLYRTSGYAEIPAYGAVAHTHLWFEKRLAQPPVAG
jgi:DNA-binding MarR family transcriptional regulator/GNAT superfamily N-acetyltransferase